MLKWRSLSTGPKPVPEPVGTAVTWLAAAVLAPALIATHHLLDRHGDPLLDLVALCALVGVLSVCARIAAAPGTALVCWTFLSLFAVPPMGQFSWSGHHDLKRLGCLLFAAGASAAGARLLHARAAYRRISPLT